jgi:CubicO group peptidase (beta-lactamase class C family)
MLRLKSVPFLCCLVIAFAPTAGDAGWTVMHDKNGYFSQNIPDEAFKKLGELAKQGAELKSFAFTPTGGWVILHDKNGYFSRNIPDDAFKKLGELAKQAAELKSVTFTPDGGWTILFDNNGYAASHIPEEAFKKLGELAKQGAELKAFSFTPGGGWVILHDDNGYFSRNIPDEAFKALGELAKKGSALKTIAFPADGGWVILFDNNGYLARGIPDEPVKKLGEIAKGGSTWKSLAFTTASVLKLSQDDKATRDKVLERMAHYKVPGMSIAVIQNNEIVWARGYGVGEAKGKAVTSDTLFQAASISKTLTTVAALRLVQDGKMELDGELNKYLTSWKIPENEFTKKKQPTVRNAVTHSAGFNVHGFPGYAAGDKVPSLVEVLSGKRPANTPAIRVEFEPGSKFAYSGGGFCVLQQALIDVGGKPFPKLMDELVLTPAGMKNSSFEQPLAKGSQPVAAVGNQKGSPIAGKWHTYPEMAAAGLWTTPSDLARFAIAIQRSAKGDSDAILSPKLIKEMLTPQIGNQGLGFNLGGQGKGLFFTHNGVNAGFECLLIGYAESGHGAVIMCNANDAGGLIQEMVQSIRSEYGWDD